MSALIAIVLIFLALAIPNFLVGIALVLGLIMLVKCSAPLDNYLLDFLPL